MYPIRKLVSETDRHSRPHRHRPSWAGRLTPTPLVGSRRKIQTDVKYARDGLRFEWDEKKARSNFSKHGIRFEEAKTAFDDPLCRFFQDDSHSSRELRERLIGEASTGCLLVVAFSESMPDLIRIISARRVTNQERLIYEQY